MFIKTVAKKSSTVIISLCTLALCFSAVKYSKICADGVVKGIELCLTVLVPSLFPFMTLCSFIVKSRLHQLFGRPFKGVMKHVFGLDSCLAPIILLSLIGGYPVGAKGISSLYKSGAIDKQQAKSCIMFSVCAGPGFVINYVGVSLYGNAKIGCIILCSQIISVIVLGISANIIAKIKNNKAKPKAYTPSSANSTSKHSALTGEADSLQKNSTNHRQSPTPPLSTAIVEATYESARGILGICIFVVIFSAFTHTISSLINDPALKNSAACLLEVCTAVNSLSKEAPIEAVAFATGFGGLCVHFQIFSVIEKIPINKLSFFTARVIQGVITAVLTHIGLSIFPETKAVFSTATVETAEIFGGTVISALALITVSVCFLYSLKNSKA